MPDWKSIGVPVIVAIIAGTVSLISAYTNFIISSFFTPNIQISKESAGKLNDKIIIDITNNGTAAAKSLRLTVQAPPNTSFIRPIFSTEKYSENNTGAPTKLEMYVPRFVQGTGSLIRIESLNHNDSQNGLEIILFTLLTIKVVLNRRYHYWKWKYLLHHYRLRLISLLVNMDLQ